MDIFVFKLLLTFLVGSLWITYVTVIAEKLGPKIGGVLAGIPSTTLIALFFIGWTQTAAVAAAATTVLPLALGFSVLFAVIYILLSKVNFYLAIVSGMATWFAASLVIVLAKFDNFPVSLAASIVIISCSFLFVEYVLKIRSRLNVVYTYSFKNLVFRGLLSGSIITSAVFFGKGRRADFGRSIFILSRRFPFYGCYYAQNSRQRLFRSCYEKSDGERRGKCACIYGGGTIFLSVLWADFWNIVCLPCFSGQRLFCAPLR